MFLGPFKAILTPLPRENPLAPYLLCTRSVPTPYPALRTHSIPSAYNPRRKTLLDSDWSWSFWTLSLLFSTALLGSLLRDLSMTCARHVMTRMIIFTWTSWTTQFKFPNRSKPASAVLKLMKILMILF